jgi:hypothetical protein
MKYNIDEIKVAHASRGWVVTIAASFPTHRQFTREYGIFENTGTHLKASHSLVWSLVKMWWFMRSGIKYLQSLPGEFELT